MAEKLPRRNQAFPVSKDPSESWVAGVMWMLRNPGTLHYYDKNSLAKVTSRFARYALLHDQV